MLIRYVKPSGILSRYIKYYWVLEIDASEGEVCERVVPIGTVELMFHYRQPFFVSRQDAGFEQPRSLITGVSGSFCDVVARGGSGVIAVTFHPFGACNFFDFPLAQIENGPVDLRDIDCGNIRRLEEQVYEMETTAQRISAIERFLMARFAPVDRDEESFLRRSVGVIDRCGGRISTAELCGTLSLSEKSLERKFGRLVGKSPKQFSKIVRFKSVLRSLGAQNSSLAAIALENGYFDQAHFIKDFKALSGFTPGEFITLGPCASDYFS